jgi:hypothetical protein
MRTHVDPGREVVGLVLGLVPHQRRVLLRRVDVVRQPGRVVEDLGQPPEAVGVGRRVVGPQECDRIRRDRFGEEQPLPVVATEVAQPLVVRPHPVVGGRRRAEPALADEAPLPDVVGIVVEP